MLRSNSWRLNEDSDSSGDRRAVGSRFQVLGSHAAKKRWRQRTMAVNVYREAEKRTTFLL